MKKLQKWAGHRFESSSVKTAEFKSFFRDYKSELRHELGDRYELIDFSAGHFYASGFINNKETGKLVYISIPDVRYSPDGWMKSILIRTAEHTKDYSGGSNNFTTFDAIIPAIEHLSGLQ